MGRRSIHTAEELRELILKAATEIIVNNGLSGLSAREIARQIGYSPGTLYNVFENLDDLILTIEGRMLDQLAAHLASVEPATTPEARLRQLSRAYLKFTHDNPKLWNLLFEHHLPQGRNVPAWYQTKLDSLMAQIEDAVAPLMGDDALAVQRTARVLWAGVHGITSLSTADKLSNVTTESAGLLVDDLITTYVAGLQRQQNRVA